MKRALVPRPTAASSQRTFANLEAVAEGRDVRIGRPWSEASEGEPLPVERVSEAREAVHAGGRLRPPRRTVKAAAAARRRRRARAGQDRRRRLPPFPGRRRPPGTAGPVARRCPGARATCATPPGVDARSAGVKALVTGANGLIGAQHRARAAAPGRDEVTASCARRRTSRRSPACPSPSCPATCWTRPRSRPRSPARSWSSTPPCLQLLGPRPASMARTAIDGSRNVLAAAAAAAFAAW